MPYAIINNIRMHFETAGKGDAVLLINGLSAPAAGWALQVNAFAPHFTVVTFDNRGVGETDLPAEPVYSTGQMADDAAALLRHLKIARAHVLGASMGGTIAMELALRHPRLVRSLTLACTWVEADARFLHTLESWISLAYRVPIEERYRHVVYPWLFTAEFFAKKENVEQAFQRSMAYPHQTKAEAIERQGKGIMAWNGTRTKKLASIRVPTLVLVGRDDILTPPAFSRQVATAIRRARLSVLPGGHGLFLEQADLFNRTVLRFLKSVRSK
ncbi:MAG TPA: alpha/beta fold hydrolase [Methylomirabilota bacterium]|jgi:pimeloyl-ACP methyl ester carboxylesterase|nr:alpha/beta fold hydrolase [Methylomirabilota bacterium]